MDAVEALFTQILKRDGSITTFDFNRIVDAIFGAAQAVGGNDRDLSVHLANQVIERLQLTENSIKAPTVEDIQDTIEKTLIDSGHAKTAKAFILYRQKRKEVREIRSSFLSIEKTVDEYLQQLTPSSSRVSFIGLQRYAAESILTHYALNKIYPPSISEAHRDGKIYIHNLSSVIAGSSLVVQKTKSDDQMTYLKTIQRLSQEWSSRVIIEDFEETLFSINNCYPFLEKDMGESSICVFIQKPETLLNYLKTVPFNGQGPGLITSSHLLSKVPVPNSSLILTNSPVDAKDSASLLGILASNTPTVKLRSVLGVVSLNLHRIAQENPTKKDFMNHLLPYLQTAKHALLIKKKVFVQNESQAMFPVTQEKTSLLHEGYLGIGLSGLFQASELLTLGTAQPQSLFEAAQGIVRFIQTTLRSFEAETKEAFAIDFITSRECPFYEPFSVEHPKQAVNFMEILPFATFDSSLAHSLSSNKTDLVTWSLPH